MYFQIKQQPNFTILKNKYFNKPEPKKLPLACFKFLKQELMQKQTQNKKQVSVNACDARNVRVKQVKQPHQSFLIFCFMSCACCILSSLFL